jgi:hypothetical protein
MEITEEFQAVLDAQAKKINEERDALEEGLKKNNTELLDEKAEWKRIKDAAVEQAGKDALDKAKAEGDIKTVSASYDEKLLGLQSVIDGMKETNLKATKSQLASDFMSNIGATGSQLGQDAMKSEYLKRIDIREGKTVVLDPQGNLTALSLDDLNTEFSANSRYAENIKGTQATGGGADGSKFTGGVRKSLKEMTATEEAIFANQNPEQYKQMRNLT